MSRAEARRTKADRILHSQVAHQQRAVEAPFEEKVWKELDQRQVGARDECADEAVQPLRPLLERVGVLNVVVNVAQRVEHHVVGARAHQTGLRLQRRQIDFGQIAQHGRQVLRVGENSARRLCQVIERRLFEQRGTGLARHCAGV